MSRRRATSESGQKPVPPSSRTKFVRVDSVKAYLESGYEGSVYESSSEESSYEESTCGRPLYRRYTWPRGDRELSRPTPLSLDESSPSFKKDLRRFCLLLQVKGSTLSLFSATCARCGPSLSSSRTGNPFLAFRTFEIVNLSADCVVCDVINRTHDAMFGNDTLKPSRVRVNYSDVRSFLQVDFLYEDDDPVSQTEIHVQLYSEEQNHSLNPFPVVSSNVCLDVSSSAMVSKIQGWIDKCLRDHDDCKESTVNKAFIPKRLIRIDNRGCHLISSTSPVHYAALSYCWGHCEQPSTTKANVNLRYSHLQSQQLPQTIQDAISMTQMMNLNYLWVDSICIVQDDTEEWAEQASNMADVYSSAYIVLAATGVSNVADGFLRQHCRPLNILSLVGGSEHPVVVSARIVNNHDIFEDDQALADQPLSKRGWALQERALATRTVHFLPDELLFECRSGLVCECGQLPGSHSRVPHMVWPREASSSESGLDVYMWTGLVEKLKRRCFTYRDDVLPALSGMAQRTLPLNPGQYFAGVWEKDIAHQLGWRDDWGPGSQIVATDLEEVDQAIRSRPTFTWATSPGPVLFEGSLEKPICSLLGGQVQPVAGDIFGQVKGGSLRLQGRSIQGSEVVRKLFTAENPEPGMQKNDYRLIRVYLDGIGEFFPSTSPTTRYEGLDLIWDWSAVLCLGLSVGWEQRTTMLLLQPSNEEESYIRVGVVANYPGRWFDEFATECVVTVV